jgi:hypothetical protein
MRALGISAVANPRSGPTGYGLASRFPDIKPNSKISKKSRCCAIFIDDGKLIEFVMSSSCVYRYNQSTLRNFAEIWTKVAIAVKSRFS